MAFTAAQANFTGGATSAATLNLSSSRSQSLTGARLPDASRRAQASSRKGSSVAGTIVASLPGAFVNLGYLAIGLAAGNLALYLGRRISKAASIMTLATEVTAIPTDRNQAILKRCSSLLGEYRTPWLMGNPHVETIFAAKFRISPEPEYKRELLTMADGGTVAVDWLLGEDVEGMADDTPTLILLPGLTGGSHDSYVAYMAMAAAKAGIRPVVFNSRSTSDSPVTTGQFYSASFTGDMREVVAHVSGAFPKALLLSIGWSLGANIMLRYLGEVGSSSPIHAAASLCNPFTLTLSNANMKKGFNRIYDMNLATSMRKLLKDHREVFEKHDRGGNYELAMTCSSIDEFDVALTVPCFGWGSVDEYYENSSSSLSIPDVAIPLLCIQAENDPIAPAEAIPYDAIAANPNCILVTTPTGGHLGWTAGPSGVRGEPWTDRGVLEYFKAVLELMPLPHKTAAAAEADSEDANVAELQKEMSHAW